MRITVHVPKWVGKHNSGGEWFTYLLTQQLKAEIRVLTTQEESDFKGIDEHYQWADKIITHLGTVGMAMNYCQKHNKPLIYIYHNDYKVTQLDYKPFTNIIFNSEWVKESVNTTRPNMVFYPPIRKFTNKDPKYITLINCNENKGGQMLIDLAKRLPDRQFLGVIGSYSKQITETLPNLKYIDNTPDIQKVFDVTETLIVPSKYESFGMAACEAMKAGIRVLANPTPGLKESLNEGAIFCKTINDYLCSIDSEKRNYLWIEPKTDTDELNDFINDC